MRKRDENNAFLQVENRTKKNYENKVLGVGDGTVRSVGNEFLVFVESSLRCRTTKEVQSSDAR